MKRKILLMAAIILCLSISAYGTLAFFTTDGKTHNIITSGGVDIEIVEQQKTDDGLEPFTNKTHVMPDSEYSKIVTVKNVGKTDVWVRVKLEKKITLKGDGEVNLDYMTLVDPDTAEKWTKKDGYYYYNVALAAGESTTALLGSVKFSKDMGNEYQNATAKVIITAEAVQYANNPDGSWPDTVLPLNPKDNPQTDPEPEPEQEPTEPDADTNAGTDEK